MVFRLKTSWKVIKLSAHGNVSSEILMVSKYTGKRYSRFFQLPPKGSNFHRLFSEKNEISRVRIIRSVLDALKVAVQFSLRGCCMRNVTRAENSGLNFG